MINTNIQVTLKYIIITKWDRFIREHVFNVSHRPTHRENTRFLTAMEQSLHCLLQCALASDHRSIATGSFNRQFCSNVPNETLRLDVVRTRNSRTIKVEDGRHVFIASAFFAFGNRKKGLLAEFHSGGEFRLDGQKYMDERWIFYITFIDILYLPV